MSNSPNSIQRFSDFSEEAQSLDGEKIRLDDVLNMELLVTGHRMASSKYQKNQSGKCLTLQVEIEGQRRVIFTGSDVLIGQVEKYKDKIPFIAIIKKVAKYYTLS